MGSNNQNFNRSSNDVYLHFVNSEKDIKYRQIIKEHLKDPLFKNSYYLYATALSTAGFGFFFWILAARLYTVEEVGLGSAILSAAWLISIISSLGFDVGLIKYLPGEKDKSRMINSCFTVTALTSLLLSVLFILSLHIWSPTLMVLQKYTFVKVMFVLYTVSLTLFGLQSRVFVAFRLAKYSFMQGIIGMVRILILPLLVALGAFGVFLSAGLAIIIALIIGNILILKVISRYRPVPVINKRMINDMIYYSFGNNIANILYFLPSAVLPLMVVEVLGKEINAYFYVAWATSAILIMISYTTSLSLFAEGSLLPDKLRQNVIKSLKFIYIILIPAIIGIFIFGKYILLIFGRLYADNAFDVLLLLSLGTIPHSIIVVYVAIMRVKKDVMPVIIVYGGIAVLTIVGSYIAIQEIGLIGIGISWIFSNGIVALFVIVKLIGSISTRAQE